MVQSQTQSRASVVVERTARRILGARDLLLGDHSAVGVLDGRKRARMSLISPATCHFIPRPRRIDGTRANSGGARAAQRDHAKATSGLADAREDERGESGYTLEERWSSTDWQTRALHLEHRSTRVTPDWLIGRPVDWLDWVDAGYTRRLRPDPHGRSSAELLRCLLFARAHAPSPDSIESSAPPRVPASRRSTRFFSSFSSSLGPLPFPRQGILIVPLNI